MRTSEANGLGMLMCSKQCHSMKCNIDLYSTNYFFISSILKGRTSKNGMGGKVSLSRLFSLHTFSKTNTPHTSRMGVHTGEKEILHGLSILLK